MQSSAHDTYLATQVQTATPQKLRLMLIDGAIRWGEKTKQQWAEGGSADVGDAVVKFHKIVGELLASVRSDDSELARKITSVYAYLFRTLTEALRDRDIKKVDHVLSVLVIERETWRQVCAKFGAEQRAPQTDEMVSNATPATTSAPQTEAPVCGDNSVPPPPGISIQA